VQQEDTLLPSHHQNRSWKRYLSFLARSCSSSPNIDIIMLNKRVLGIIWLLNMSVQTPATVLAPQEKVNRRRAHRAPHPAGAAFKHHSPPLTCPHLSLTFHSPTLTHGPPPCVFDGHSCPCAKHGSVVYGPSESLISESGTLVGECPLARPVVDLEMVPLFVP
jgi:hypothetical protein